MKKIFLFLILSLFFEVSVRAQLTGDETHALLHVVVTDFEDHPLQGETVIFKGIHTKKEFSGSTNAAGKFDILLPEGDTYIIAYLSFIDEKEYSEMEIPAGEGIMEGKLTVQMETDASENYELDILFETARADIKGESFSLLDRLASQMKLKPTVRIELGGHTDSDGDDAANLTLSQNRAAAVKNYLVKKGVDAGRITTKGYGETKPVADNSNPQGKAKNRRTEVRVTQW